MSRLQCVQLDGTKNESTSALHIQQLPLKWLWRLLLLVVLAPGRLAMYRLTVPLLMKQNETPNPLPFLQPSDPLPFYSLGTGLPFHILCSVSVLIDSLPGTPLVSITVHTHSPCSWQPLLWQQIYFTRAYICWGTRS